MFAWNLKKKERENGARWFDIQEPCKNKTMQKKLQNLENINPKFNNKNSLCKCMHTGIIEEIRMEVADGNHQMKYVLTATIKNT